VKIIGRSPLQCVLYIRQVTGNSKVKGYAGNLRPEGQEPRVGSIALDRRYGHVSVVREIRGNMLVLHDANWIRGAITERVVPLTEQRGYIY
jgi:hypothetical protein